MAEIHLWTARRWKCPVCPKAFVLCTCRDTSREAFNREMNNRIVDHLMEHRMMLQDPGPFTDTMHIVITPAERNLDLKIKETWDMARAVLGQVIDA